MKLTFLMALLALPLSNIACQQAPSRKTPSPPSAQQERTVGDRCECCEAWKEGMPAMLSWQTAVAPAGESGVALEISGTIFKNDGQTLAEGVILYVYHTDHKGHYSRGRGTECARQHGLLRGWMKTGPDGRYHFRTIRPASYPGTTIEAHIHAIVKEPGIGVYWIDDFLFDDDPLLTQQVRTRQQQRGGSGILSLAKNQQGTWVGTRDLILGKNVPGY